MEDTETKHLLTKVMEFLDLHHLTTYDFEEFYRKNVYPNRKSFNQELARRREL